MTAYSRQLQKIVDEYIEAGQPWPASSREIAAWAVRNGKWEPQPSSVVDQCASRLARAMREEHLVDPQGRTIRAKLVARVERNGEQIPLWADIRDPNLSREHVQISCQQRRQQIFGDCRQLKIDLDSYNENRNSGEQLEIVFDFTPDLAEAEAMAALTT